jgi:pyridoxamine 5'-phosphate oxidase
MSEPSPHLRLEALPADPLDLFTEWYRRAEAEEHIPYPEAMCLSTVSPQGRPEGRFVIVHAFDTEGFVFSSDARSPKALSLAATPFAALTVYWGAPLEAQVRIEGPVEEAPAALADALYHRRPRRSQATPWASRQSEVTTLAALEARLEEVDRTYEGLETLPRPDHWRAWRLVPEVFELWLARPRRLHDRFRYTRRGDGGWGRVRLAP